MGVAPGTVTQKGATYTYIPNLNAGQSSIYIAVPFKVQKYSIPTLTFYSPSTGASGVIMDYAYGADVAAVMAVSNTNQNQLAFRAASAASNTIYNLQGQWTASAEL